MRICITRANKNAYSETFIRDQIKGLAHYAEIDTVYSGWMPERSEDGKRLSPFPFWVMHKIVKRITGNRRNFFSSYGLQRFFRDHHTHVVLANYGIAGACLYPVCRQLRIPLVIHFHGFDATHQSTLKKYGKEYKRMFLYAAAVIAVSNDMKNRLIALGAPAEKIYLNPYGIDIALFQPCDPSANPPNFISVGRFTPKKAPDLLIRAFHIVAQKYPEARLVMIGGDDGLLEICKSLVDQLSLKNNVHFAGILNSNQIRTILGDSRAFVQHSVTAPDGDMEGTPVAILEASASGLPVISTKHAGIKDAVIHGETGLLVDEHDVEKMAKYMIQMIEHPEMAKEMGQKGRTYIEQNYAQDIQVGRLFDILQKARSEKGLP